MWEMECREDIGVGFGLSCWRCCEWSTGEDVLMWGSEWLLKLLCAPE